MQVIEKNVWLILVNPAPFGVIESDDEDELENLEEDELELAEEDLDDDEDFEGEDSADVDFAVRLLADKNSTIDRVLEMFNASRAVLGVGPNDTVVGISLENSVSQISSVTH
jgi:hypothetical protein